MRNLIALLACLLALSTASANDPPAAGHGAAEPAKASAEASKPAAEHGAAPAGEHGGAPALPSIKPKLKLSADAQRASDEQAEAELSAKIATRLAALRANQAARIAAAARVRKAAVAKAALPVPPPPPAHGTHWSYEGELGPANWSKINVDWAKCGTGNRQSPIDIRDGMKVELEQFSVDYKPSEFSVTDNGHTVQVTLVGGNYITVAGRMYELLQFHFHRPSEERINGKGFEMVVHLVHRDAEGKLAVVAVLLERGKALNVMQTVWNNLPLEKQDTVTPTTLLDPSELLPARREYFTYMGSLTTPPCSEGVLWLVMKQPMQATPAQMALFSRLYPLNARPIQASSGRMIKESN